MSKTSAVKQPFVVTGCGKRDEWKWTSDGAASHRIVGMSWRPECENGATLFECLSRRESKHIVKRTSFGRVKK